MARKSCCLLISHSSLKVEVEVLSLDFTSSTSCEGQLQAFPSESIKLTAETSLNRLNAGRPKNSQSLGLALPMESDLDTYGIPFVWKIGRSHRGFSFIKQIQLENSNSCLKGLASWKRNSTLQMHVCLSVFRKEVCYQFDCLYTF